MTPEEALERFPVGTRVRQTVGKPLRGTVIDHPRHVKLNRHGQRSDDPGEYYRAATVKVDGEIGEVEIDWRLLEVNEPPADE